MDAAVKKSQAARKPRPSGAGESLGMTVLMLAFNPSTRKAEAEIEPQVQGQPGLRTQQYQTEHFPSPAVCTGELISWPESLKLILCISMSQGGTRDPQELKAPS